MYLVGADLTEETDFASMVFAKRVRKELKKYYHVLDMKRCLFDAANHTIIEQVSQIYKDPKYTIRKPRFSQIGRPKKMVNERPLIFVRYSETSHERIDYLKQKRIPATCVMMNDEEDWCMKTDGKCLKNDFYIPKHNLIQTLLDVIEQGRLILHIENIEFDKAVEAYRNVRSSVFKTDDGNPFDDLVLALAMPVWYYEHLLSIRPRTP